MLRYTLRMFADQWRQWTPAIAVVAVIATMVGLCVHQFAWTGDPAFQEAVVAAQVPVAEFRILSVTIYTVVTLVAWVSLTVVGRASVQATERTHAMWLLLGASPRAVFAGTLAVLAVVTACGAILGAIVSTVVAYWAIPTFNGAVAPAAELPGFATTLWAPAAAAALSLVTALLGGLLPAWHAARVPPGTALRAQPRTSNRFAMVLRIAGGALFIVAAIGLVVAAGFAEALGSTSAGSMFNLAVNAGGCALIAVYFLSPQITSVVLRVLHAVLSRAGLVTPSLGVRAAADRVQLSATTIAPLAAGLGGIGMLLCAVNSVVLLTQALQPGTPTDLTDVWTIIAVVAVAMLATSAAVVALSTRSRGREIALLQVAGMRSDQVRYMIAAESFAMSAAASTTAMIPVLVSGVTCALVSSAALDRPVVAWPIAAMVAGLLAAWLVLFLILLAHATAPLRNGPSAQLREQGI